MWSRFAPGRRCSQRFAVGVAAALMVVAFAARHGRAQSPYVEIPTYVRTFTAPTTRGFQMQAPCNVSVVGVRVPNEFARSRQHVALFDLPMKAPVFPASTTVQPAWSSVNAPSGAILPVSPPVDVASGRWLGVVGACSDSVGAFLDNSYGARRPFVGARVGGQATTLFRLIAQSNVSTLMPSGGVDLASEDPNNTGRVEVFVVALGGSDDRPPNGSTVTLTCEAGLDAGLTYALALSLSGGPTPFGERQIDLGFDFLLLLTAANLVPNILTGARGVLDAEGLATAQFMIPPIPSLVGAQVHAVFLTFDAMAPLGVRSISKSFVMTIS